MSIIRGKIDVTKIPKDKIFVGTKGKYVDFSLMQNRDGTDQYGNDFFIVLDVGKEARERGEKGPIIGNAKYVGQKPASAPAPQGGRYEAPRQPAPQQQQDLDEDVPF